MWYTPPSEWKKKPQRTKLSEIILIYTKYTMIWMAGNFEKCPECDSENLIKMGGCDSCHDCGWSACPVA